MGLRDRAVQEIKKTNIDNMIKEKLFLLILCSTVLNGNLVAQESRDTLFIKSVDFNILTFSSVSCEDFDIGFTGRITSRTLVNKDAIETLKSLLARVTYSKKNRNVDVRAKFLLERPDQKLLVICTDGYNILIDGRLVKANNKFAGFLSMLTLQSKIQKLATGGR